MCDWHDARGAIHLAHGMSLIAVNMTVEYCHHFNIWNPSADLGSLRPLGGIAEIFRWWWNSVSRRTFRSAFSPFARGFGGFDDFWPYFCFSRAYCSARLCGFLHHWCGRRGSSHRTFRSAKGSTCRGRWTLHRTFRSIRGSSCRTFHGTFRSARRSVGDGDGGCLLSPLPAGAVCQHHRVIGGG